MRLLGNQAKFLTTIALFLLLATSVSAQNSKAVSDSLRSFAAGPGGGGEASLQDLLDGLGYNIDVANDETGDELFCAPSGVNTATMVLEVAGSAATATSGFYHDGATGTLFQLFSATDGPGSSATFSVTAGDILGFYMEPNLSPSYTWFSETSENVDAFDHVWVFPTGNPREYLIAFEDLHGGGDGDYQDLVFRVTFHYALPSLIGCPSDLNLNCDDVIPAPASVTAASNPCEPTPTVAFSEVTTPGSCINDYVITRTWTATDIWGGVSVCSQTITVTDNSAPVLVGCPADVTVSCDAVPSAATVTATDNCDVSVSVSFSETTTPGLCTGDYTLTRTWTATDACGNSAVCTQTITVEDNTDPVLVGCPADVTVSCDAVPPAATVTATDNCGPVPSVTFNETTTPGACGGDYTITRTWSATDDCGNNASCIQTITVEDNTDPILVGCPADVTVSCDAVPSAASVTATDNCDASPSVAFNEITTPGACAGDYTITRTWTATDDCGNSSVCSQTITVEDNSAPVIAGCPADITVECDAVPAAATLTATDNCDGAPTVSLNEVTTPGICGGNYTITRTWTATDACGNSSNCVQVVTVEDTTPLVLAGCPADMTVSCDAVPAAATVTATDNCDGAPTVALNEVITPGAGTTYTITRTWTGTDDCGNSANCVQVITVQDNTDPVLVGCPADVTVECDAIPAAATVTATDNCDTSPTITFNEVTTPGICDGYYTITRTWTATDDSGNEATCTQTITVEDTTAPVLAGCPADVTVSCDAVPTAATVTATDNCDPSPTVSLNEVITPGGGTGSYTITRTWTATDDCGNNDNCVQVITVQDNTDPVLVGCPADVTVQCDAVPAAATVTATDNCDTSPTVTFNEVTTPGVCDGNYTITRTWTATDDSGNEATCTQTITVEDTTDPVLAGCPTDVTVQCDAIPAAATVTATDNCDPSPVVTFNETTTPGICDGNYTITRTWTATDECGNQASCSQTITVEDTTDPTITVFPGNVTVQCMNQVPAVNVGLVTATDNCDPSPVVTHVSDVPDGGTCPLTIARTYRVEDECGNAVEQVQTITVQDDIAPVLSGCPADLSASCDAIPAAVTVTATDNCDPSVSVTMDETTTPGACANSYTLTRTWTATDACGNVATCSQDITVTDSEAPVLFPGCPADVTVACDAIPTAPVLTATDNCDASVVVQYNSTESSGSPLPCPYPYVITRTWTATDACGNSTVCTQLITVEDNGPPQLSGCPSDLALSCSDIIPDPANVVATDDCDPNPTVDLDSTVTPGACANEFVLVRTWTASDACGNSSSCSQTITITDTEDPVCGVPADQTITLCQSEEICLPVTCTDNCDINPTMTVINGPGVINAGNWCYTPTGDEVAVVTVECTDACGNTCQSTFTIDFDVNLPPVATCPGDQLITVCDLNSPICIDGFSCSDPDGNLSTCVATGGSLQGTEVCLMPVAGPNVITLTATDDCGITNVCQTTVTVVINSAPACDPIADISLIQCEAEEICATISASDVDGNLDHCEIVSGPGAIDGMDWCWTPTTSGTEQVTVRCYDACGLFCETSFEVVVDLNEKPSITCTNDTSIHWGTTLVHDFDFTDPDPGQSTSFSLGAGTPGSIDAQTGVYTFFAQGQFICNNLIEIIITDSCGLADTCDFDVCVVNDPPIITCSEPITVCLGETVTGSATATDPDGGPSGLLYTVASFDGPGTIDLNPATGEFSWETLVSGEYAGTFTLCLSASDGAATCDPCSSENSDTCCVVITVVPAYQTIIEKRHAVIQGQVEPVSIYLDDAFPMYATGGFNFLIEYDASVLSFLGANPGALIDTCGWEYFTYRYGANGNCGPGACPSGKLRVIAIAETNNGVNNHPSCFTTTVTGELVQLDFLVTNDRTMECQYVPIRFCWYECVDNAYSSVTGDTLFISRDVYEYGNPIPVTNPSASFPSLAGANTTCDVALDDGKPNPIRCSDFYNGGIDIVCADSIDGRGDINLNEIPFEVADAVLFSNYFVYGTSVFVKNINGQIAASDVNADGITLSVADLVYTVRVVVGDALPYPKISPLSATIANSGGILSVDERMGAAYLVIEGNSTPVLIAKNMDMKVNFDGTNTRVLISKIELDAGFSGEFIKIDGELLSIEMATYDGQPVVAKNLPQTYSLDQNYPNPFNPSTTISFRMPSVSEYVLTIYNVSGQKLATFSGMSQVGENSVEWNAGEHQASGVYFYRLDVGNFSETRKMILLK